MLEDKLDRLATQLSVLTGHQNPTPTVSPEARTSISRQQLSSPAATSSSTPSSIVLPPPGAAAASGNSADDAILIDVDGGLVSLRDAAEHLHEFRTHYTPHCPFVALHPEHTIETVRKELPITFMAIIAVMESRRPSVQAVLRDSLQRLLFTKAAVNGEASLDLLRGLIIYGAWHYYFLDKRKPRVFLLIQLCLTLVHELNLERTMPSKLHRGVAASELEVDRTPYFVGVKGGSDEKRLLLGAYWFSAGLVQALSIEPTTPLTEPRGSRALRKSCSMRFTGYMADCARELTDRGEYATDKFIGHSIRSQTLASRVAEVFSYYEPGMASIRGDAAIQHTADSFFHELKNIENGNPAATLERRKLHHVGSCARDTKADKMTAAAKHLFMADSFLESWVYEVAIHDDSWHGEPAPSGYAGKSPDGITAISSLRNSMLWRLLNTNNRQIEKFLALPDQELRRLCVVSYSYLCYTLISQARVTFALLDAVGSKNGGVASDSEEQVSTAQLIVDRAGYVRSCTSLIEKFDIAASGSLKANDVDAMQNFSNLTRAMVLGYSKQLQDRFESSAARLDSGKGGVWGYGADAVATTAASALVDPPRAGLVPVQGRSDGVENTDWAIFDFMTMDGVIGIDEKAWEALVSEVMEVP